jgi:DNA polymerase-3 subunit alpha
VFVHLHLHSEFSALDGLTKIDEAVEAAKNDGQPAVALTDHGTCAGHPHLKEACEKAEIKPIFGIEANFTDDRRKRGTGQGKEESQRILNDYQHLILWAKTTEGLRHLWAMSTEAHRDGFYGRPRMDWDTLSRYHEGVMASTGCLRGPLAEAILRDDEEEAKAVLGKLLGIFGDDLYVELQTFPALDQQKVNYGLVLLAKEQGLPLIAAVDSHYPALEDQESHKVWIASQTNKDLLDDTKLFGDDHGDFYVMAEKEVRERLSYLPDDIVDEAIANTVLVADKCDVSFGDEATPPVFSREGTLQERIKTDVDWLVDLCLSNWSKCEGKTHPLEVYEARFEREMRLLIDRDFCGYFLMVSDYVRYAREHNILVGPGRGSGSASLVSYLSGITGIDPVEAGLMFERFLTEGRKALPDFDVDFPTSKRQELTDYIIEKYGVENVVRVGTHIRLKNKGVVRDLARVLKSTNPVEFKDIEQIAKIIDVAESDSAGLGMSWEDLWDQADDELAPFREKYPILFKHAEKIVGRLKTYGKHAAGVVISPDARLVDLIPLRSAGDDLVAEFDLDALEKLGLVKFDLLTLRNLDTIQMTVDLIQQQDGVVIDVNEWDEEYDDSMMWDQIGAGHTLGIFQIETPGGTRDTKRLQPKNVQELADVVTLVRPGPKRSGLTETYYLRKIGQEAVSVPDPRLEPILNWTYGVMLYQEQVIQMCMTLAGYTSVEADVVRKILGKKQVEKIEEEGKKFLEGASLNGTDARVASTIWSQMAEFSRYSFNKSHAYGYAMLGVWCAWPKFHYPVQFLTACMSTVDKGRIPEFITEARRMGIKVLPPDINISGRGFTCDQSKMEIRYGFEGVKEIGPAAVKAILDGQPYHSMEDFLSRKKKPNMGVIKILAQVGAFDSLVENRRKLEMALEWETESDLIGSKGCQFYNENSIGPNGLPCVFDWDSEPVTLGKRGQPLKQKPPPKRCTKACRHFTPSVLDLSDVSDYEEAEIMEKEMQLLGIHLSVTPFDRIPEDIWGAEMTTGVMVRRGNEMEDFDSGEHVVIATISKIKPHIAKNKKAMGFVGFYAVDAELDVTVFSDEWEEYQRDMKVGGIYMVHIRKNDRGMTLIGLQPI